MIVIDKNNLAKFGYIIDMKVGGIFKIILLAIFYKLS
jgi:hypothetical protein